MVEIGEAETPSRNGIPSRGKRVAILVDDKRRATLSDKPNAQKKEGGQHRIPGDMGCNHI